MKKLLMLGMVFGLIFSLSTICGFASSDGEQKWEMVTVSSGDQYLLNGDTGEKIGKSWEYDSNCNLVEISLDQRLIELNNCDVVNIDSSNSVSDVSTKEIPNQVVADTFTKTGQSVGFGNRIKVTPDIGRGGTVNYGHSEIITDAFSGAIGGSYDFTSKLKGTATFTWQHSVATNEQFGVSFKNDKWAYGHIAFTPKMNIVQGDTYRETRTPGGTHLSKSYQGVAYGYSPIKLSNGFADGRFDLYQS